MKIVSWNVNGLRAVLKKDFEEIVAGLDADMVCLQETKVSEGIFEECPARGYEAYWDFAQKKGYSGTAIFTRHIPLGVSRGIGRAEHDTEGRVTTAEYPDFYLVCVYTPNAQGELARLPYRLEWEEAFREYVMALDRTKPVIICGDLNVAHNEIDLKNPASNRKNPGFSDEERAAFSRLLDSGFADTFRRLHPKEQVFSWWSYRFQARKKNIGWRIDYFLVSERLLPRIREARIHTDIEGSDHCPVSIIIE